MRLREILEREELILVPGAYEVMSAQLVERSGYPVSYVTGLGHEASDLGCPDLGLTNASEIIRKAANIVQAVAPRFAAMKAVERAAAALKAQGTTAAVEGDLCSDAEYEQVVKLSTCLRMDREYGGEESPGQGA